MSHGGSLTFDELVAAVRHVDFAQWSVEDRAHARNGYLRKYASPRAMAARPNGMPTYAE
jgi:hypothetical protein